MPHAAKESINYHANAFTNEEATTTSTTTEEEASSTMNTPHGINIYQTTMRQYGLCPRATLIANVDSEDHRVNKLSEVHILHAYMSQTTIAMNLH